MSSQTTGRSGGSAANKQGNALENIVKAQLETHSYEWVSWRRFKAAKDNGQPIYSQQYPIAESIYGTQLKCDFLLYNPQKWSEELAIECKWQQSPGSVDEKFPYLVLNLGEQYPCESIILADGDGAKPGAIKWLKKQVEEYERLLHVFNMNGFQKWSNKNL